MSRRRRRPPMLPAERRLYERNCARLRADEPPCWLCGGPIDYELRGSHPGAFSADHIVPLSAGGSNEIENLRAAHFGHNSARGDGRRLPRTKGDRSASW